MIYTFTNVIILTDYPNPPNTLETGIAISDQHMFVRIKNLFLQNIIVYLSSSYLYPII